jgi:hypothetical protein
LQYTPPTAGLAPPQNSKLVEKPFDTVWKELVPALGGRFFVINNLDKASGLINISYSGSPEAYVDCGEIVSWVDNVRGKRTYSFPGSSASQTFELKGSDGRLYFNDRKMSLEGRMNVILESLAASQTRVTVNTRYVLTRSRQSRRVDLAVPATATDTIAFNSGQRAEFAAGPGAPGPLVCQPTGRLESDALDLVKSR